jgi:glucose/mannose-6-phosphate isomerase
LTLELKNASNAEMLQRVTDLPNQIAKAYSSIIKKEQKITLENARISSIVIQGMGGSAIAGEFARVLLRNCQMPIYVNKSPRPPHFLDRNTLFIAMTYSGKTQETLDALNYAISAGSHNVVITSSHELASICSQGQIPCILVPGGSYPRTSIGSMLVALLGILDDLGVLSLSASDFDESITILNEIKKECGLKMDTGNFIWSIAGSLNGKVPVIYGECDFTDVVALRWKQNLNENSKMHCYYDAFPELLHNEIEVWSKTNNDMADQKGYCLILLRDLEHEHNYGLEQKVRATKQLAESNGTSVLELWSRGQSELARMLSLSFFGDLVSVFLAILNGKDSTAIPNISFVKNVEALERSKKSSDIRDQNKDSGETWSTHKTETLTA